jgi:multidrug efflux pump subunit AcrA (membrane-fusion protein)
MLFRIDPVPFESKVHLLEAQLRFAELRFKEYSTLQQKQAGRAFDVEQHGADVEAFKAQLEAARWDLDKTTVRAPADGVCDEPRPAQGRACHGAATGAGHGL